jgi:putative transposase
MKLVATVKLVVNPEQAQALQETLETANQCCEWLSERAWETQTFGQYKLHRLCYAEARSRFPLSAQVVVRCIAKVADAYKLDRKIPRHFKPHGSIAYDDRILRWQVSRSQVSIWTIRGRLTLPFVCGERQRELLQTQQGESDLSFRDGHFYLSGTCNVETPDPIDVQGTLGVDLGIVEIATDSEGNSYSGEKVRSVRRRLKRLRGLLQSKGTKSAKRHLKKLRRKQSRFVRHENHRISKQIVATAVESRKALALEDLKGIRERGNGFSREMRWLLGNWAFDQLRQFVAYKAEGAGIPVVFVDPRNSSRTCSACGYIDKANRKTQALFSCLQCGFQANADYNAAVNLAARGDVTHPNVWAAA